MFALFLLEPRNQRLILQERAHLVEGQQMCIKGRDQFVGELAKFRKQQATTFGIAGGQI